MTRSMPVGVEQGVGDSKIIRVLATRIGGSSANSILIGQSVVRQPLHDVVTSSHWHGG